MSSIMPPDRLAVAIDGPAASGKSSVALGLARRLGLLFVDSGSMYRAVTLLAIESETPVDNEAELIRIAATVRSTFRLELRDGETLRVFVGEREVTEDVRSPGVGDAVSPVSEVPGVREEMVRLQRCLVEGAGAVVEGRDIGTTVLPDAPVKIFLEAPPEERTRRRLAELREKGVPVSGDQVAAEIEKRDRIDSSREVSPLSVAPDAVLIDTAGKTLADVVDEIVGIIADRGLID
ncbi:MAG: (d)CMP kinase [Candidatus Geothermincolia bacterium]